MNTTINKIEERNSRRSSTSTTFSSSITIDNFSQYIADLRLQRLRNPKHPKLYDLVPLPQDHIPDLNLSAIIPQLKNDTYLYTGIIKTKDRLYTNYTLKVKEQTPDSEVKKIREFQQACQDNLFNDTNLINDLFYPSQDDCDYNNTYYEFVDPSSFSTSTFINYKYLYLPVIPSVTAALNEYLPHINKWEVSNKDNNNNPITYKSYPDKVNLLHSNNFEWLYFIQEDVDTDEDRTHPFLGQMYYTGRYNILDNGNKIYEYFDSKGYYGQIDNIYYSSLEPKVSINLKTSKDNKTLKNSGITIPQEEELYTDTELQSKKGYLPKEGEFINSPHYIEFSGYITNDRYDSTTSYYVYIRKEDGAIILSTANPVPTAKTYIDNIKTEQGILYNDLVLIEEDSEQEVGIEQESLCIPVWLEDNTNNSNALSIFGDCLLVTDDTFNNPCLYINQSVFGDCVIISESYIVTE